MPKTCAFAYADRYALRIAPALKMGGAHIEPTISWIEPAG